MKNAGEGVMDVPDSGREQPGESFQITITSFHHRLFRVIGVVLSVFLFFFIITVVVLPITWIFPCAASLYAGMELTLPASTRIMLAMYSLIQPPAGRLIYSAVTMAVIFFILYFFSYITRKFREDAVMAVILQFAWALFILCGGASWFLWVAWALIEPIFQVNGRMR